MLTFLNFSILLQENCVVACAKSETIFHALTGNKDTYKDEELSGEHRACITAAISSTVAAIQELLEVKAQLWVCDGCRHEEGTSP